jgi:hypothetical protein
MEQSQIYLTKRLFMDKIKAYSYLRFSTDRQRKGSSFARQKKAINSWLKKHP